MSTIQLSTDYLQIIVQPDGSALRLASSDWPAFHIGPLTAGLTADGEQLQVAGRSVVPGQAETEGDFALTTDFAPRDLAGAAVPRSGRKVSPRP